MDENPRLVHRLDKDTSGVLLLARSRRAAKALAEQHGGRFEQLVGDAMLAEGFPAAHAVGRGASPERAPRILTLRFRGSRSAPTVALVGKGVVFDTGGLDIKPRSSMRNMKKDMGGAAVALAPARGAPLFAPLFAAVSPLEQPCENIEDCASVKRATGLPMKLDERKVFDGNTLGIPMLVAK